MVAARDQCAVPLIIEADLNDVFHGAGGGGHEEKRRGRERSFSLTGFVEEKGWCRFGMRPGLLE